METRVEPTPTIEDLLGECRECNRLMRDCGNHEPVTEKRKCLTCEFPDGHDGLCCKCVKCLNKAKV